MEQKSMTALISLFARVYHFKNDDIRIFSDSFGEKLLSEDEYQQISNSMKEGIQFFNPKFSGKDEEALKWIVDNQLSPTPLGRAVYTEKMLKNSVKCGATQYLIFAAGYDTFAYRQPDYANTLQIFEIDHALTSQDKQNRVNSVLEEKISNLHYVTADFTKVKWEDNLLNNPKFDGTKLSFCSLLGISYYLTKNDFAKLVCTISSIVPEGSSIVFDYPDENTYTKKASERTKKQNMMASGAGEKMLASYSYFEMEKLLSESGFLIYEHLEPNDITEQYFNEYNKANNSDKITAFDNVNYCLAVKK